MGKDASTSADANSSRKLKQSTPKAGDPFTNSIKNADNNTIIKDVLISEVWLASGQSNMHISLKGLANFKIAGADKMYVSAKVRIVSNTIVVSSHSVSVLIICLV